MLARIIVISERLAFLAQLYNSFARAGNLRLKMTSGSNENDFFHLFYSVSVQHLAHSGPGLRGATEDAD